MTGNFQVVCEIEPPVRPDLKRVRHQIGVLSPVASTFLIPDYHLVRATVSSVAGAHEVEAMGGRSVLASAAMARRITAGIPDIEVPGALRDSGAFDGVYLIPVGRYREVAAKLEAALAT